MNCNNLLQYFVKMVMCINHSVRNKKAIFFLSFFLLCFLASCSDFIGGPPQDIEKAAVKALLLRNCSGYAECKDFQLRCANNDTLDRADNANGVTERWCLNITYLITARQNNASWYNSEEHVGISRINGKLILSSIRYPKCCRN